MCLRHSLGLRLVFRKHLLYDALAEDIRGDSLVARCLVSVERALYIYPIGEVTRLPFEWYCRCQKARLVHHTCKCLGPVDACSHYLPAQTVFVRPADV